MTIAKTVCPECGAKISSPDGFDLGEMVECPKCETEFKVRAPKPAAVPVKPAKPKVVADAADDEDYEDDEPKPKKKKQGSRRDSDDGEKSYKNSPLRFVILGVLVLVMLVGGFFLVKKILAERAAAAGLHPAGASLARTANQTSAITLVAVA